MCNKIKLSLYSIFRVIHKTYNVYFSLKHNDKAHTSFVDNSLDEVFCSMRLLDR